MTRQDNNTPCTRFLRRPRSGLILLFVSLQALGSSSSFLLHHQSSVLRTKLSLKVSVASNANDKEITEEMPFQVKLNEFFKRPVPPPIRQSVSLHHEINPENEFDAVTMLTAAPSAPGYPRPLWLVLLGSLPSGLLWYGYYKFAVEEELLNIELERGDQPRGFGGYGTLGCFSYGMMLGPLSAVLHAPGELYWSSLGVIFIYYTQFLLHDRVNALYTSEGREAPLQAWWSLPVFLPFNFIVGLRQVHFLSQYLFEKRGVSPAPSDPVADFFPFIKADKLTWQELFLAPRLWCSLFASAQDVDKKKLPSILRYFLSL